MPNSPLLWSPFLWRQSRESATKKSRPLTDSQNSTSRRKLLSYTDSSLTSVMGWIVFPLKFASRSPHQQDLRMWLFFKVRAYEEVNKWKSLGWGLNPINWLDKRRHQAWAHREKAMWGPSRKVSVYKPSREALGETNTAKPPELWDN